MVLEKFALTDKVVIVTGGAGYYGRPICIALAQAGATVIIASRNQTACQELALEIKNGGGISEGFHLDLSAEASIHSFTHLIYSRYGRIDVLINNAVSREGYNDLGKITKEGWEKAMAINSTGLVLLTQSVIKIMLAQGKGNIINIGSIQGVVGPNFSVYGNTGMSSPLNYTYEKWALVGFTKWVANFYGKHNIRCNCISPGGYGPGVEKDFGQNEFVKNYKQLTPLGRFANDEDIQGPVIFLASEASSYITGHNLIVDGGWTNW